MVYQFSVVWDVQSEIDMNVHITQSRLVRPLGLESDDSAKAKKISSLMRSDGLLVVSKAQARGLECSGGSARRSAYRARRRRRSVQGLQFNSDCYIYLANKT